MRWITMNENERVDESCMERLALAVEALLLSPDASKGLESAFLSLGPIQARDFPTKELAGQFTQIEEKHLSHMKRVSEDADLGGVDESPLLSHLRYSRINGRTKHWFKQRIWELFKDCSMHNES
jgi:hypothetical protein